MPTTGPDANAVRHADGSTRPPRVYKRDVKQLSRVHADGRTLYFTFPTGTGRSRRCRVGFVEPRRVPDFVGDTAWFEMEQVEGTPWTYWRAVRQVEPPSHART